MTDIFLSYTERDRDTARRLAEVLDAAGWSVWWDRRIPAGETWRSVLQHALEDMRCMVVLWSTKSIESEWVCEEATEGRRLGKLVPVFIEAVRPPAGFREIQAADLTGWSGSSDFHGLRMLLSDLERLLGKPGARVSSDATPLGKAREPSADPIEIGSSPPVQKTDVPPQSATAKAVSATRWPIGTLTFGLAGIGLIAFIGMKTEPQSDGIPKTESSEQISPQPARGVPPGAPTSDIVSPLPTSPDQQPDTKRLRVETESSIGPQSVKEANAAPAKSSSLKRSDPAPRSVADCSDLLMRIQLGETLSESSQMRFNKECRP
jgi:TIR domain